MVEQKYFRGRGQTSVLGEGQKCTKYNKINNNFENLGTLGGKIAARELNPPWPPLVADLFILDIF